MAIVETLLGLGLTTWLVFLAVFLFAFNYVKKAEWRKLPPGPFCFPLVGSLPYLGSDIREPLRQLGKKYGDVFTIYLGGQRVVVLNSYDAIKEALVKYGNQFSDRPDTYVFTELTGGWGIITASGHSWREQRRFTYNVLREFGMGRSLLEDKILEEATNFNKFLQEQNGKPFNAKYMLSTSISNIICAVVFGRRFEYDDPDFKLYMKIMSDSMHIVGNNGILSVFPWLRHFPGDFFKAKELDSNKVYMDGVFKSFIDAHKDDAKSDNEATDLIGAYVKHMEKEKENEDTTFIELQLMQVIGDLFTAGTETTATTLLWGMIYMMRHPEIQERVQEEIDSVLSGNQPSYTDRENMPYTEACILEMQRLGDIVPFSVPHATSEDVEFRGHFIPKGTMVFPSCYSVHMDESTYPEPQMFDPQRFLDDSGKLAKKEQHIPFSVGRRMCLGEGLAKMELFLFFVSIMQKFSVKTPEGRPPPSTRGIVGITHFPRPYEVCLHPRTTHTCDRRVIVLNSYEVIKEALVKLGNYFSDRPDIYFINLTNRQGVICASGHLWREQRRFSYNVLREFGMGRPLLEEKILEEVRGLNDYFSANVGVSFDPKYIVSCSVSNIICSVVFGRRFEYSDPDFKQYMHIITSSIHAVGSNGILSVFPLLRHLPGDPFQDKLMKRWKDEMDAVFTKFIIEHRNEAKSQSEATDFIGAYIRQLEKEKDDNDSTFSEYQLVRIIGDLFAAGTETTATTLLWGMIYMMRNPEIQKKVQKEILETLGPDQPPGYKDRERMPFVEATILEIQRLGDITPFSVPHCTSDDVEFRGYHIPKGTMVMPSCYSVHMDAETFPEPTRFNPYRFLDHEGRLSKKEQLIPFSVGRRMCLGEGLARMELFLFFVSIFQEFTVTLPESKIVPGTSGVVGVTHCPHPFEICLRKRDCCDDDF